MPRRSAADLAFPRVDGRPSRLKPPATLSDDVRAAFRAIVASVEPEHFKPVDSPLIAQLATARVLLDRANSELERGGAVAEDGRPSPWVAVREKELRAMITLSTRLRLTPQSRYDARAAARNARPKYPPPWEIRRPDDDDEAADAH